MITARDLMKSMGEAEGELKPALLAVEKQVTALTYAIEKAIAAGRNTTDNVVSPEEIRLVKSIDNSLKLLMNHWNVFREEEV
jgi:hypothetical protein